MVLGWIAIILAILSTVVILMTLYSLISQKTNWTLKKAFIINHVFFYFILLF